MTDEELGRKWCAANGREPLEWKGCIFSWDMGLSSGFFELVPNDSMLPKVVARTIHDKHGRIDFTSEADAYAAVGVAIRQLLAFADGVRATIGQPA